MSPAASVASVRFPQEGGCLCGEIRYRVRDEGVMLYACHCTDCQRETGTAFYLAWIVHEASFERLRGEARAWEVRLPDGRIKGAAQCPSCSVQVWGPSRGDGLMSIPPGTLDDPTWVEPAGHIWTRSKQVWVQLPDDIPQCEKDPGNEDTLAFVRAWKGRDWQR